MLEIAIIPNFHSNTKTGLPLQQFSKQRRDERNLGRDRNRNPFVLSGSRPTTLNLRRGTAYERIRADQS